ncbi:MAG TPA: TonB-dependent receptor [Steroidobacteraceae bacterium]|nr:TonB-dependent receptor [Steroidobacteraceae bacterium]
MRLQQWAILRGLRAGQRRARRALGPGLLAVCVALQSQPGFAQSPGATDSALEEVVVTAQFRQQGAQSAPIALTAISSADLEARSQTSVEQIAAQAPNVVLEPGPAAFGPSLQAFIRGVGQSDFNFAFEPGVGMYVDDVYYATLTGSIFDLLDLDHVEVLRGPQGTLAGMNSEGGSIKLYTKKPTGNGGGYLEATYGRFDRTEVRAAGEVALVPGELFVRLSGVAKHEDGYVNRYDYACTHPGTAVATSALDQGCLLGTEGGIAYSAVRAALRWVPTDKLEVNLSVDNTNDNSQASPSTLLYVGQANGTTGTSNTSYPRFSSAPTGGVPLGTATGSPFISYSPYGPYAQDSYSHSPYVDYSTYCDPKPPDGTAGFCVPADRRLSSYGFAGTIDYALTNALSLKSITGFRSYNADWAQDEDGSPLGDETLHDLVWHRQWTEELRLEGRLLEDAIHWTVGGFYLDETSHYGGRIDLGSFEFFENDLIPAKNKAGFLNLGWKLSSRLELNAGVRYSNQNKTFEYGRLGVPGNTYPGGVAPQVAALNGVVGNYSGSKTDYRAALQYQWFDGFMTYADVSTGFKGGGINPRPFYPSQVVGFNPEHVTAYELGIKSEWFDHRLRANLAGFWNRYSDIQFAVNNCSFIPGIPANQVAPCAAFINAGDANVKGAELEIQARPVAGLSIDASASLLDFNYVTLSSYALKAGITTGMTTPFAPRWKFSSGIQYAINLGAMGTVTPRLDVSYQASMYESALNALYNRIAGYSLVNGRLTWASQDDHWETALQFTNLGDKLYYTGVFDNRGSSQTVQGAPGPPQQWAITLKRNF